ncbi:hypothetical protein [Aeromonas caviae]|uniref:hypothetical protein n=1 Tax=Aeromonas caviae TaxID=648 RepID=UPI002B4870BF|nr:hypothetical protein [Aeromonas caviae]
MKTKHAHIIEAMRLPSVPVVFAKRVTEDNSMNTTTNGFIGENMTLNRYCACCHQIIIGNGDQYCTRQICVDLRAAAEHQKYIDDHGKYILQWVTFDAQTEILRFDDEGECYYHASLIRGQVADLFVIHPDGSSVELRQ